MWRGFWKRYRPQSEGEMNKWPPQPISGESDYAQGDRKSWSETHRESSHQCLSDSCVHCIQVDICMCSCLDCSCSDHCFCKDSFCTRPHPHGSADLYNWKTYISTNFNVITQIQIHRMWYNCLWAHNSHLANPRGTCRCKRCSLQMDDTLPLAHMDGRHREPAPHHRFYLYWHCAHFR